MKDERAPRPRRSFLQVAASVLRLPLFWQLAALVSVSVAGKLWLGSQTDAEATIRSAGVLAPLLALVLQSITMMTPMGTSMIPTLNGMLFPLPLAIVLNLLGGLAGGIVLYYVWRQSGKQLQIQERLETLPRWAKRFAKTDLLSLTILRMLPWAGGNYANFLAGVSRVPLHIHIVSVVLGAIPGAVLYAMLGMGIIAL